MSRLEARLKALEDRQSPQRWDDDEAIAWADSALVAERYNLIPPPQPSGIGKLPPSGFSAEEEAAILAEAMEPPHPGGPTPDEIEDYQRGFPPGAAPPIPPAV